MLSFFSPAGTHVFAHRGLATPEAAENTLAAFKNALDAGATHLETDVQATKDGVAVLFHDNTLTRVAGVDIDVRQCTFEQLQLIELPGGPIPSLEQALLQLKTARFNLDIKRSNAILPAARAIIAAKAADRVLVSSFSDSRRKRTINALTRAGYEVATGMGLSRLLLGVVAAKLGSRLLFSLAAKGVQAVQVPFEHPLINLKAERFVRFARECGLQINYWVVNDVETMKNLVTLGANGIVSDRADDAVRALRH